MGPAVRLLPLIIILGACSTGPAAAQTPSPIRPGDIRPNVYDVAPEQALPQEMQDVQSAYIEVSGTGSVSVAPDRAQASFAVETQARTAGEASSANATRMETVVSALRRAGMDGLEIETFGYSLRPDYVTVERGGERLREIGGYTALNNIRARIDDVDGVGRLIDAAVGAGANRVSSLAFEASDTEDARLEALAQAVRRATAEAEAIALALGRQLGAPLEVRGGAESPTPRPMAMAAMASMEMARADTPVEAGEQTVRASVTIRFALGAERSTR